MSRSSTSGGFDDPAVSAGDRAFLRVNSRLEPSQLRDGELSLSRNGRMERGVWQPRKAITSVSGALQEDGDPLRLPFFLVDTSGGALIATASRVDSEVTVTVTGHGFATGLSGYLGIEGLTGSVIPNGVQYIAVTDADTFTFFLAGAVGSETYGGSGKARSVLDDSSASAILASCAFSDPASDSLESIVIAANGSAYRVSASDNAVTAIPYPTGATISTATAMLQAFDRVFLFRDGLQTWEWFGTQGRSVNAAVLASNVVTLTLPDHGLTTGDSVVLSGIGYATTDPNGTRTVTGVGTDDTFTFALTGGNETFTAGTGTAVAGFTKVRAGTLTQPQVFEVSSANADVTSGLATFTVTANTTVKEGDTVVIFGASDVHFLEHIGRTFKVTAATSSSISFYIAAADHDGTGESDFVSIGRAVSVGGGLRNMPAPAWGVYHQRRLIAPFRHSQTGDTASPVFTDRDRRDELMISDILDPYTYDEIENQFRVTAGIADFTVAAWPFYEDRLLVFNRNSIHQILGLSGSLADTATRELTREIGCLARKSIAQHGAEIMFLSDSGVYSVGFIDEYNLRGVDLPLSDPIQPEIDRINADIAGAAVGIYFNNRYWLAVPLDSSPGAGDAAGNNAILVYNFLNQGWESVDTVADARWSVLDFHIVRSGQRNDLYAVNSLGGVHKIDSTDYDFDTVALNPGGSLEMLRVPSLMRTRQYDGGTLERKRWAEVQLQVESSTGLNSDAEVSFLTEDSDGEKSLGSFSDRLADALPAGEDASLRIRTGGQRSHGAIVGISPSSGRPRVKAIKALSTITNRSTTTQV